MRADRRVGAAETCLDQAGGRTQITPLWRAMPHHVPLKATGLLVGCHRGKCLAGAMELMEMSG